MKMATNKEKKYLKIGGYILVLFLEDIISSKEMEDLLKRAEKKIIGEDDEDKSTQ